MDQTLDPVDVFDDHLAELIDKLFIMSSAWRQLDKGLNGREGISNLMRKPTSNRFERSKAIGTPHEELRTFEVRIEDGIVQSDGGVLSQGSQQIQIVFRVLTMVIPMS